jgi:VanZ family protein
VRIALPPPAPIRALCIAAFLVALLQLFVLDEPRLVKALVSVTWDKACHATAYGAFAMLLWFGIGYRSPRACCLAMVFVGACDEIHQYFVPGRDSEVLDVVADAVGAAIAIGILHRMSAPARARLPPTGALAQPGD